MPEPRTHILGGQAVIEGVMMKGPRAYSVAVRKQNGEIRIRDFPIAEGPLKARLSRIPLVRGVVSTAAMLSIGLRALRVSADEAADVSHAGGRDAAAPPPTNGGGRFAMAGTLVLALLVAVLLFFVLPLVLTRLATQVLPAISGRLAFNLADGLIRVLVFVAYVLGLSAAEDIRRVFQYHGAEHKVINAYESRAVLVPERVREFPRLHPRCGTSFILFVMAAGVVVFSFIPHGAPLSVKALMRVVLLPAIAGIAYEILRLTVKKGDSPLSRSLMAPGLLLQRLTTREPDLSQIEVAIASFRRIAPGMRSEGCRVG
jgi:uncharacterized protein YqhQ